MNPIKFECPHCHEIIAGDESLYGQQVKCRKCQETILVPPAPAGAGPLTARLIQEKDDGPRVAPETAGHEADIFTVSPTARAYLGRILLGVICLALGIALTVRARDFPWSPWTALVPFAFGVGLVLSVWISVASRSYRLTTQRLFVRRGWLAKHVDELELYRVKDVAVDQGILQRILDYGTVTVQAEDETTPKVDLTGISGPTKAKEMIRTQYRAARQREGVHPTEFMRSL